MRTWYFLFLFYKKAPTAISAVSRRPCVFALLRVNARTDPDILRANLYCEYASLVQFFNITQKKTINLDFGSDINWPCVFALPRVNDRADLDILSTGSPLPRVCTPGTYWLWILKKKLSFLRMTYDLRNNINMYKKIKNSYNSFKFFWIRDILIRPKTQLDKIEKLSTI